MKKQLVIDLIVISFLIILLVLTGKEPVTNSGLFIIFSVFFGYCYSSINVLIQKTPKLILGLRKQILIISLDFSVYIYLLNEKIDSEIIGWYVLILIVVNGLTSFGYVIGHFVTLGLLKRNKNKKE